MARRLITGVTWLLVAGSMAIILGGLFGRPVLVAAVPTASMVPVFRPGDLIPVWPLWGAELRHGDIIVFRTESDKTWIVHRIVGGDANAGFVTQGDANPTPDKARVFPRHVAGRVPAWGDGALHLRRVGTLALGRGPLSNPLVAISALVLGFYLLMTDVRPGQRRFRWPHGRQLARLRSRQPSPKTTLAIYLVLSLVVFIITTMTTWSLGFRRTVSYRVVASQSTRVSEEGVMIAGQPKADTVTLRNQSVLPLIFRLGSNDPALRWEPELLVVGSKQQQTVTLYAESTQVGQHQAELWQAVYLPVAPKAVLRRLSSIHRYLPLVATGLIPAALVLMPAVRDSRVRLQIERLLLRLRLRL